MKYCVYCGAELDDNDSFCGKCGQPTSNGGAANPSNAVVPTNASSEPSTLATIAKVFMIITTVCSGFFIIPLCWMLPMTLSYCKKIKNGEKISIGFGICVLLFVSLVSGICILVDNNNDW